MSNVASARHLCVNPQVYEPQRSNTFRFVVTNIDNILRVGADPDTASAADYIQNAQESLEFSINSASVPTFSQNPIEIRRGNSVMKAAGVPTFEGGQIDINDYVGSRSVEVLQSWQNLSYNVKTEKVGYMKDYKKDCYLLQYDIAWNLVSQFVLHGCWVSGLNVPNFDYSNGDKRMVSATIQYDWAEIIRE